MARFLLLVLFCTSPFVVAAESYSKETLIIKKTLSSNAQYAPVKSVIPEEKPLTVIKTTTDVNTVEHDKSLNNIQSIVQTGAVHLALINLDKQQPSYSNEPISWLRWERERITLLNLSAQNKVLVERVNQLPSGIPVSFLYWVKTQQASAYIKLQNYNKARQSLTEVIWGIDKHDSEFKNKWLPHWRRLIIQSYLSQGLLKDAHISITRFRQDYGQGDVADIVLYARVLLMNKLADEALAVLSPHTGNPEAGMLYLLAQLRKDSRSPRKVLQASLRQMQGEWVKPELKTYLWSIVAEAAQRSEDRLSGIKAMEFVLSDADNKNLPKGLFKLSIDDLWNAYVENAIKIGNQSQYLMGDDPVWLNAAQAFEATQPINARSLYAFLILRGQDTKIKQQATTLFLKSLSEDVKNKELVKQLFLSSTKFNSNDMVPFEVRHYLVDYALAKADIRLASELMSSIKITPQGTDKFMWQLRRARVLVMGGKPDIGASALINILEQQQKMKVEDIDKLMQVVFDLQTVKEHQNAYNVFEKIIPHIMDAKRKREIYYWMADSKKALTQHAEAASLYLKSAVLPANDSIASDMESGLESNFEPGMDPWGQTARYQAASNLAQAGLIDDARALYKKLLESTKEESRIKVLRHELQQLWLLENRSTR